MTIQRKGVFRTPRESGSQPQKNNEGDRGSYLVGSQSRSAFMPGESQPSSSHQFHIGQAVDYHSNVYWGFDKAANFNVLMLGASGSGKTYSIHNLLSNLVDRGVTPIVFDIKDDFGQSQIASSVLHSGGCPPEVNEINFDYVTGDANLNPLKFSTDVEGGGVYMAIRNFCEIAKIFNPNLSRKMEGYLSRILRELYEEAGIVHSDPGSWFREPPTLEDLSYKLNLIDERLKSGFEINCLKALGDKLYKLGAASRKLETKVSKRAAQLLETDIEELKETLNQEFTDILENPNSITKGEKSFDPNSLGALADTVQSMTECGLFSEDSVSIVPGCVNRIRISGLASAHQQTIMWIVTNRLFMSALATTKKNNSFNPRTPRLLIVADEGKHIGLMAGDILSPSNRCLTEGRGLGLGMLLGVQSLDHVSADGLRNFGTKMITKVDQVEGAQITRKFGVPQKQIDRLVPQKNCLFDQGKGFFLIEQFVK